MPTRDRTTLLAAAAVLVVVLPVLNTLPPGSPFRISNFTLNPSASSWPTPSSPSAST